MLGAPQILNQVTEFRVIFLGKKLRTKPSASDLGMQINQNLNYDEHDTQTVSKRMETLPD